MHSITSHKKQLSSSSLVAIVLFCSLLISRDVEARTYTNTAGKTIDAELTGMKKETALLKLKNGKQVKIPLSALSEADQLHIKKWWEENKNKVTESDVRMSIEKNVDTIRQPREKDPKKKNKIKISENKTTYTCNLSNSSQKTLKGIQASYVIYKRVIKRGEGGSGTSVEETTKTDKLYVLEPKKSLEFETAVVACKNIAKKAQPPNCKGQGACKSSSRRETVMGMVVTLSIDGKEFLKQGHPKNFIAQLEKDAERAARKAKADKSRD